MKRSFYLTMSVILLSVFFVSAATAEFASIDIGKGTLKMGGIFQTGFTYNMEDSLNIDGFTLNRARFLFWGDIVPDKIGYFLQFENKGGTGILDFKGRFFYIPNTEITVGRFLPNFTLYMPNSTAKLEMINYPLTVQKFAMWRQMGIQTTTKTEWVDFNVGIFNGADVKNNIADNNDAKDILLRGDFKLPVGDSTARVGGYFWKGSALATFTDEVPDPDVTSTFLDGDALATDRFGGFGKIDYPLNDMTLKFRGEFLSASTEMLTEAHNDSVATVDSQAYFAHVGLQVNEKWELLGRYDFYDPNTDSDVEDDSINWITFGLCHYIEGHNAMVYLNYIMKGEESSAAEIDNDMLVLQAQICF